MTEATVQIENDYDQEVYNGDIGYIDDVDPDTGELTASFDRRSVAYGFGGMQRMRWRQIPARGDDGAACDDRFLAEEQPRQPIPACRAPPARLREPRVRNQ
jgi:hypothetical protein